MKTVWIVLAIVAVLYAAGVVYGRGTSRVDRGAAPAFDIRRYMGEWYEIARYDHRFERNLTEVKATYRLAGDDRIEVINTGRHRKTGKLKQARGKGKLTDVPGRLKVAFFWNFYSDYNILELDDDYAWALVGSSSPKYLWILSRTPTLPAATLNRILRRAEERGYSTARLIFVDQQP